METYNILIPKIAITDREALVNKAIALATRSSCAWEGSTFWWNERGDEIIFCFKNGSVAALFMMHCKHEGIRFRAEWQNQTEAPGNQK
jgi:hypothetical protein